MVSKNITVQNEEGIHLRPASMLVDQANKFRSRIRLSWLPLPPNVKAVTPNAVNAATDNPATSFVFRIFPPSANTLVSFCNKHQRKL